MVCPLNWGLGHASRMIPIVYELLDKGNRVILGGDGDALRLLSNEFPKLKTVRIQDISVRFSSKKMIWNLLGLVPKLFFSYITEHRLLKKILINNDVDVIISDNRYGLWNKNIKSVLVTHQLMIKLPRPFKNFEYLAHLLLRVAIARFDTCWVPDYASNKKSLSGDLSHKYKISNNTKYIGPLSRFAHAVHIPAKQTFDVVAVLSGPEPLRSQLENQLIDIFTQSTLSTLIVQGKPAEKVNYTCNGKVSMVPHLSTNLLASIMQQSKLVICRSGYSSIMDLACLKVKALLIPTPGQSEQEYLALHLKHRYDTISQKNLSSNILHHLPL